MVLHFISLVDITLETYIDIYIFPIYIRNNSSTLNRKRDSTYHAPNKTS